MRQERRGDHGSATVWVAGCVVLLLVVGWIAMLRGLAVTAKHRVESAADLAALAAAQRIGVDQRACPAAAVIAAANGARLVTCSLHLDADGRSGTVLARVAEQVTLPLLGHRSVVASARAGRLPAPDP